MSVSFFNNEDNEVPKGKYALPFAWSLSRDVCMYLYIPTLIASPHNPFIHIMTVSFSPPISGTVLGSENKKEYKIGGFLPSQSSL